MKKYLSSMLAGNPQNETKHMKTQCFMFWGVLVVFFLSISYSAPSYSHISRDWGRKSS